MTVDSFELQLYSFVKAHSHQAKAEVEAKIFFDMCRLFYNLFCLFFAVFGFYSRYCLV